MSLVEKVRTNKAKGNSLAEQIALQSVSSRRRIISARPGENVTFSIAINSPPGHRIEVYTKGLPSSGCHSQNRP